MTTTTTTTTTTMAPAHMFVDVVAASDVADDASLAVTAMTDMTVNTINSTVEREINCLMQIHTSHLSDNFTGCPTVFDSVSCWPQTTAGTLATLPCFTEFLGINYDSSQNATRYCRSNGTWDTYTNYDQCKHVMNELTDEMDMLPHIELATNIYSAGYTLSLIALSLGLIVFLHFKDLRCLRNTIHANLFLTYILSALLWILPLTLGLTANEATGAGCKCLVILLHYFSLTNFFWMLVEGLYLYMLVVQTFSGDNLKFKMYAFIGWGCPAIIIGIWTGVKAFTPIIESEKIHRVQMKCTWMHESYVDWIFHGPELACLLVNLFFLVRIMWVLITKLRSANTAETRQYKKASKALLVLIPLLGITYLVVWIGPESGVSSQLFVVLRAFLISTQGFSVSLLYCFLNSEVKQALCHRFDVWREKRNIGVDMDYRKHRNGLSKEYSSPRSRTESIRLTSNSNGSSIP